MEVPEELFYTMTHEWIRREGRECIVGISAHAQQELRDIVFVELPKVGALVSQGKPAAVIESVKAAFDIYAPVSGRITKVNEALTKSPQIVNQDCYQAGWLFVIEPSAAEEFTNLLSPETYRQQVAAQAH